MSGWAYYFIAKAFLHLRGHIPFDVVANAVFAVWVMLPLPAAWAQVRWVVWVRRGINVTVAALLAWHDSWLPPLPSAIEFVRDTPVPSTAFLADLAWRSVVTVEIGMLLAVIAVAALLHRRVRLVPVVLVLFAVVAVHAYAGNREVADEALASFYARQAEQTVTFSDRPGAAFDVVLLHVCSLSWDDLDAAGMAGDPFFDRFDLLFTRFNSVTAHSNPSAIRLLRSGCGQTPHDALYRPAREDCYLTDQLAAGGYRTYLAMNHDGVYGGFLEEVTRLGHADPPIEIGKAPIRAIDFTGEPVYDDYAVLADWWRQRRAHPSERAMLYYNTIVLHDGGRPAENRDGPTRDRPAQYAEFTRALFRDFERFFALIEADGGRAAVVVVAEHGVALRGSRVQPAGLREVPLPSITTVPAGIKLVGSGWFQGNRPGQRVVERPTSYRAIANVLAQLTARPTLRLDKMDFARLTDEIPSTDFVSENQGAIVLREGERYLAKGRSFGKRWVELPADAIGAEWRVRSESR
jgi:cellulose synthase operon protein YhjU